MVVEVSAAPLTKRAKHWLMVLALALIALPLVLRSCAPLDLASLIAPKNAPETVAVIRDRYETVRVEMPTLRYVNLPGRHTVEHDTILDTAIVRSLVATLDSARHLLRSRGVRSSFSVDTALPPLIERLWIDCDETARRVSFLAKLAPVDTVLRLKDTVSIVTMWSAPLFEPYAQVALVYNAQGAWSAQAAAGARINASRHARPFIDAQAELGGQPRLRLGLDITF